MGKITFLLVLQCGPYWAPIGLNQSVTVIIKKNELATEGYFNADFLVSSNTCIPSDNLFTPVALKALNW